MANFFLSSFSISGYTSKDKLGGGKLLGREE
jgi:hypothetical protein